MPANFHAIAWPRYLAAPLLIALACQGPVESEDVAGAITPSSPTVLTNGLIEFTSATPWVNWSASAGTIDQKGVFTAPAEPGTVRVTARSRITGTSLSTEVTVAQVDVAIYTEATTVLVDHQLALSAAVSGWPDTAVTWAASDGSIDPDGRFTAPSTPGAVLVTATSRADSSRSASVVVNVGEVFIALEPQTPAVLVRKELRFAALVEGWSDTSLTWSASRGAIDPNGVFAAPETPGPVEITVTSLADPRKSASAAFEVSQLMLSVVPSSAAVLAGRSLQLTAEVTGWSDTSVTWSTSVGSIDASGLLSAPAVPGAVVVTATSVADPTQASSITVNVSEVAITVAPRVAAVPIQTWIRLASTVTGWSDTSVTWAVIEPDGCGGVTSDGVYLAPTTPPTASCHVAAFSKADPTKSATAEINVGVRAYPGADASSLGQLLAPPILAAGAATLEIRDNLGALVPKLSVPLDSAKWTEQATALRRGLLDRVVFAGRAAPWRDATTRVEWLDWIDGGPGYRIRKMRYEAVPGLWIPGLLYMPDNLSQSAPAMLHLVGHWPTGKSETQLQTRAISLAKHGVIGLSVDWYWTGQLGSIDTLSGNNHGRTHQIGLTGASGLAPFFLAVSHAIDALVSLPDVDPSRIGVTGASGGGWQSIWIAALDERVSLVNPVAGFSALSSCMEHYSDIGDFEQLPVDMGTLADYTHLAALVAPRPLLLTYNAYDECCFAADYALDPVFSAALPAYEAYGAPDALRMHVNYSPGTHNFGRDNREALYRLIGDYFFAGNLEWDATESPTIELKTVDQLQVELPPDNGDLYRLAIGLADSLPPRTPTPATVANIVRAHVWGAERMGGDVAQLAGDVAVRRFTLRVAGQWTVPAVELIPTDPVGNSIVVSEDGRSAAASLVAQLLSAGNRVLVVDPFGYGESSAVGANLMALTSALGERSMGVAASQVAAIARLLASEHGGASSNVFTIGPQASVMALVSAILEPNAIGALDLQGALASLNSLLDVNPPMWPMRYVWTQGLLEVAEVEDLAALVAPRSVTVH